MADGVAESSGLTPQKKTGYTFEHNESLLLISLYKKYEEFFTNVSYKKKAVWEMIAREMAAKGYRPSATNCENRWKCMTAAFRKCEDNNNKSGRERKECKFYNEIADIYGYRPNVRPLVTFSSSGGKREREVDVEDESGESSTCTTELEKNGGCDSSKDSASTDVSPVKDEEPAIKKRKQVRKRKPQEKSKVIQWLEGYNEERKVEDEKRRKAQEQQHKENLSVLSNLVDVLKTWKR